MIKQKNNKKFVAEKVVSTRIKGYFDSNKIVISICANFRGILFAQW